RHHHRFGHQLLSGPADEAALSAETPSSSPAPAAGPTGSDVPETARVVLLGSVFLVASCGLVYELVAGAVSSYLLGDAVTQFSLVIGVFMCSMGVGSFLAQFIERQLLRTFVELEIWLGLLGGLSSLGMFAVSAWASAVFVPFFYGLCAVLGILIGIEIPLLVRILGDRAGGGGGVGKALSHVLALDYLGALGGSILFPFVVLPWLGLVRASVLFGVMNLAVAAAGLRIVPGARWGMGLRLGGAAGVLVAAFFGSATWIGLLEDRLYQDEVVFAQDTPYQRIVLTRWREDVRLYLNGHLQFSAVDEARYHESLVVPAMEASRARSVLILGGGDGLALREVLKYPQVESVTLVDIDPAVTELASRHPVLRQLNGESLASPKLTVHHRDAMGFLEQDREFYGAVLIDLPDPSTPTLSKLYSRPFYALVARRLSESGVMVTQATSPFFARRAFWCIVKTIENAVEPAELGLRTAPYRVHVPSFGEWGFVLASRREIDGAALPVSVDTRFLSREVLPGLFAFGGDIARVDTEVNRLDDPILHRYYERGWQSFN
ncbi:MAG: polyamine aminopropyltransferase, partial [Acidobacteriota bacterium]